MALVLAIAALSVGLVSDLKPWVIAASTVAVVAIFHWPVTLWAQEQAIDWYLRSGRAPRALALAVEIRNGAMTRKERDRASIDIALVQLDLGEYENAVRNLRGVLVSSLKPVLKAVVDGNIGYALAHLGQELDEAETRIQQAIKQIPDEPLFEYFLAVVRLKQQRPADARQLVLKSLEREPDLSLPFPGERPYVLGLALMALGDQPAAAAELAKAAKTKGRFGKLAALATAA